MDTLQIIENNRNLRYLEGAIRVLQEEHKRLASEPIDAKTNLEISRLYIGVAQALTLNGIAKRIRESVSFEAAMDRISGQNPG